MVFTALDVFTARLPPLEDERPAAGSALFDYIVGRLLASFHLPGGVAKYYRGMLAPSLARKTILDEWPAIRAELDAGRPCPLGLVTVRSINPVHLGKNHQVLACDYRQRGSRLTIMVYDPNTRPDPIAADHVRIALDLADHEGSASIVHNVGIDGQIRGFFRVPYHPADPSIITVKPSAT